MNNIPAEDNMYLQKVSIDKSNLDSLFHFVNQDFPFTTRLPFFIIRSAMKKELLQAVYLTDGSQIYGYAIYQHVSTVKLMHVMYLAVLPEYRSAGLGSILLKHLNELSDGGVILEVDDPAATEKQEELSVRTRRIAFYKRNGFSLYPNMSFSAFGQGIRIMSSRELPKRDWLKIYQDMYNRIYGLPLASFMIKANSI